MIRWRMAKQRVYGLHQTLNGNCINFYQFEYYILTHWEELNFNSHFYAEFK